MDPVDLTRRIEPGMPVYPGDPGVGADASATMDVDGYRVTHLSFTTHVGTHIDAPSHMEPDGATLDEFDVGAFRFDARLVDLTGDGSDGDRSDDGDDGGLDAREPITPAHIPDDAGDAEMLVLRTGWGAHWGEERYYDHPYLTPAAARHVAALDCAVGLDTINPDPTPTPRSSPDEPEGVPAHHELLGAGQFIVENLALPADLPERFTLRAYPLRVDADGAPVRAVAE
ncbi:cyclase family protein [Halobaculum marinum]|uniref:Cyclase family protein n=1 Tax=Halobaculum marinum TaxID=3031996 RepID=A0ABD5WYG0_9EURY|nr:cyclase family protein [Halobaculum sp. DT55]